MYKVFSDDDKTVILDWIESLRPDVPVSTPVPNPVYPADPAAAMLQVIEKYQARASQTPQHDRYSLMTPSGRQSVRACFQGSARDVLVALAASPEWVKSGDPDHSPFLTDAVSSYMSWVFKEDEVQVIRNWIQDGAKIPKQMVEFRLDLAEMATPSSIQHSSDWYGHVLGFTVVHKWKTTWMIGRGHMRLGLFWRPNAIKIEDLDQSLAITHFAFRTTAHGFEDAQLRLKKLGIPFTLDDTGIAHSLFLSDPDGYQVEITVYYK